MFNRVIIRKIGDRDKIAVQEQQKPFVLWLTGLSGSGKSTLANSLNKKLYELGCRCCLLDGDDVRQGVNKDLGFTPEDRKENIRRIAETAKLLVNNNIIVIVACISPFLEDRNKAKKLLYNDNFIEIFVDASIKTCKDRDSKGLYKKALEGKICNFTGIDSPYEKPENAEMYLNTERVSVSHSVDKIVNFLSENHLLPCIVSK